MSWKAYGGTSNFDTNKQVTTNTIITDEIVLKKSYVGGFSVRGLLDVTGSANIQGNLNLSGLFSVNDISVNIFKSDKNYLNNIDSVNNINCISTTTIGNALISKDVVVTNNIQIGNLTRLKGNKFIYSDLSGIGFNTLNPKFSVDICCTRVEGLNIYSNFSKNVNVISSNYERKGVVITTSDQDNMNTGSNSTIDFYVSKSIDFSNSDAYIKCKDGGNLEIDSKKDIIALSNFHISNRSVNKNIFNESLVVYDNSSGIYNYNIYKNNNYITGDGISIVSNNDVSSNSFLRITTPNKTGLGIAGGTYPNDTSRSMASIGLTDSDGNFVANQIIVSGTNKGKYKSSLGINTYKPKTEKYILDVNGPLHIDNGDVHVVNASEFEVISMDSKENLSIAVGSPYDVSSSTYTNVILVSNDYGSSWKNVDLCGNLTVVGGGSNLNDIKKQNVVYTLNHVFVYDKNIAFIVGNNNLVLVTNNGGLSWIHIDFSPATDYLYDFKKIFATDDVEDNTKIILYIYGKSSVKNSFLKCYVYKNISNTQYQYIQPYFIRDTTNININSYDIYYNSNNYKTSKAYFATNNGVWYMNLYNASTDNIVAKDISAVSLHQYSDSSLNNFNFIKIKNSSIFTLSSN
jgi:hypothetical protein